MRSNPSPSGPFIIRRVDGGDNLDSALGAGLGAGSAAGTFLPAPDKLVAPAPPRYVKTLLGVLVDRRMAEQVTDGYRHPLEHTQSVSFKLQGDPILT